MNVEIMAEAAQFPEKEYINGIAVAVRQSHPGHQVLGRHSHTEDKPGMFSSSM
jgi:hypothetical protein